MESFTLGQFVDNCKTAGYFDHEISAMLAARENCLFVLKEYEEESQPGALAATLLTSLLLVGEGQLKAIFPDLNDSSTWRFSVIV